MIGAGPSFTQTRNGSEKGTQVNVEFALDFMFWPTKDLGWFVEPTCSVAPGPANFVDDSGGSPCTILASEEILFLKLIDDRAREPQC
jgi:hypothetical protein